MTEVKETFDEAFYSEHGYLQLRPSNPHYQRNVADARQTFDDLIKQLSSGRLKTAFKNKDGKVRHLLFVHLEHEVFRKLMLSEEVASLVNAVFGSQRLYVTHSKISHKEAGQDLPWYPHQDNGYKLVYKVPLRKGMTIGIFLEDADEQNGTLQLFPGSQKLKTLPHTFKQENSDDWSGQIVIEELPNGIQPQSIIARQGDILIFTLDTIHQSPPNLSHGYRPLLLFEIEPYDGFPSDEFGNPPLIINGELSAHERLQCRLRGLPKKIKLAVGRIPILKTWYRRLKFGGLVPTRQ